MTGDLDRHLFSAAGALAQPLEPLTGSRRAVIRDLHTSIHEMAKGGSPLAERAEAVAALAAATDLLDRHLKRKRIAAVVRRKAPQLADKSLLELASAGEYAKVRSAVEKMFDLCRIQP